MTKKTSKRVKLEAENNAVKAQRVEAEGEVEQNNVEQKDLEQGAIVVEQPPASEPSPTVVGAVKPKATNPTKDALRKLLSENGAAYTVEELANLTGKAIATIRTQLYQLRSPAYCGKDGLFLTKKNDAGKYVHVKESVE